MFFFIQNLIFILIFINSFEHNPYSKDFIPYNTEHFEYQNCCEGCLYCKGNLLCLVCHVDYYYYLTDNRLICLKKNKIKVGEGFTDFDSRLVYKCPVFWGEFEGKYYCYKKCMDKAPYLVESLGRCVEKCEDYGMVVGKDNYHCVYYVSSSSSVNQKSSSSFESSSSSLESSSSSFESSSSSIESSSSSIESSSIIM